MRAALLLGALEERALDLRAAELVVHVVDDFGQVPGQIAADVLLDDFANDAQRRADGQLLQLVELAGEQAYPAAARLLLFRPGRLAMPVAVVPAVVLLTRPARRGSRFRGGSAR